MKPSGAPHSKPPVSSLASAASLQRRTNEAAEQRQQQQQQQQQRQRQRGRFVNLLTDDLPFPDTSAHGEVYHYHHNHHRHPAASGHVHPYSYASHNVEMNERRGAIANPTATRYRHLNGREQRSLELANEAMSHFVPSKPPPRRRHNPSADAASAHGASTAMEPPNGGSSSSSSPDPGSGSSPDSGEMAAATTGTSNSRSSSEHSAEEETKRPIPSSILPPETPAAANATSDAVPAPVGVSRASNTKGKAKVKVKTKAKASAVPTAAATAAAAAGAEEKPKKRVRYLRDTDRRNIIKRIDNGEKQAALAREFGVTRAAICHIKKNREEILSRYNLLIKTAQEMDRAESFMEPPGVEMMVHEIGSQAVLLLLTTLRDMRSSPAEFRRAAGRIIIILLEEALAILGTQPAEVLTDSGHVCSGLERQHAFCSIAIGAEGYPFVVLFDQLEPHNAHGSIYVEMATDRRGEHVWYLDHMDLPANVTNYKILLFSSTCGTGAAVCKAIETLKSVGVQEADISLVMILCASDGLVAICDQFPRVKVIVAAIDGNVDFHTQTIVPGLGDFVSRYNGE